MGVAGQWVMGAVMDEKTRSVANGYENSTDYDYEWRWWFNVLGVAIILGIVFVISL
jgi:hypothetical protein